MDVLRTLTSSPEQQLADSQEPSFPDPSLPPRTWEPGCSRTWKNDPSSQVEIKSQQLGDWKALQAKA